MPFFLATFTGTMLMGLPVSATNVSYLFPWLPKILPRMLGEDLYLLILETLRRRTISVYEFGAGMGAGGCSLCVSLGGDGGGVSSLLFAGNADCSSFSSNFILSALSLGVGWTVKSLSICSGSNHGIGS